MSSRRNGPLLLLAGGAIAAVALTHLLDFGLYGLDYRVFNANLSASWSHVVDAGALVAGAVVCLLGSARLHAQRAAWVGSTVVLGLFAVDELSGLHADIDSVDYGKLVYAPALVLLVYCVWRLTRGGAYRACAQACGALLLASYVIHVLDPHNIARALGWPVGGWGFQIVVALKEGMELAGVLLALWALTGTMIAATRSEHPRHLGWRSRGAPGATRPAATSSRHAGR